MSKKYELLESDTIEIENPYGPDIFMYRIRALRDFANVKAGDLGGYIQFEQNLSHDGNCWVYDKAQVYGEARVYDNATVCENATICGEAHVTGNAKVHHSATVCSNANVCGNAIIEGNARIDKHAHIGSSDNYITFGPIDHEYITYYDTDIYGIKVSTI